MRIKGNGGGVDRPQGLWSQPGEASLNWLALGLLLAAWNVADNEAVPASSVAPPRPHALRGYSSVSVGALQRSAATGRHGAGAGGAEQRFF